MDGKLVLIVVVSLAVGAAAGGTLIANVAPASGEAKHPGGGSEASSDELEAALKDAAEARTEALHWQSQYERLERDLKTGTGEAAASTEPVDGVAISEDGAPPVLDAAMLAELEEYRARDRERLERDEMREERNSERRADWARAQTEMLNRRTDMFTELIERTDDPAEQQRWADIERNMTLVRDLMRDMREADTDEERAAARDSLRQNYESTQTMLKEQQYAVLKRALEAQGISDASQVTQIQQAVRESLDDEAFQMSGNRGGPPGGGRGFGGFGGARGPR